MASDDFAPEEIDKLVKELATPLRPAPKPVLSHSTAAPGEPLATDQGAPVPGRRFTTARLIMPAARTEPKPSKVMAMASAMRLPAMPRFAVPRLPDLNDVQKGLLSTRMFVGLGAVLAAAMPYWPYAHAWSWGLLVYFCAMMLLVVTGIWGAKLTWDARLPAAHTVSLGTLVWGLGLLAAEAVPRIAHA